MSAFVAIVAGVVGGLAALPGAASADEDPVFVITDLDTRGPTTAFFARVASGEDHTPVDVTWEVVPASTPDAAPLLTGAASGVPAGQVPAIGTNDVLTHGARYLYRGTFEADVEPYGQVVDEATTRFTWDDTVGATAIRLGSRDYYLGKWFTDVNRFYPARDDGRTATSSGVFVSHEKVQEVTWVRTVTPKRYLTDRFVGRCASLRIPARAAWPGSVGLRSKVTGPRCRELRAQTASTIYGMKLLLLGARRQVGRQVPVRQAVALA